MSVRIYVEGGFQSTKSNCRRAFRVFFEKVLPHGSFQVIASGDRATTYKDFCLAFKQHKDDFVVLLVDSEEEVASSTWNHLSQRVGDKWNRPRGATDDQVQLMVQVMETWFLADRPALVAFYGQRFAVGSLPSHANLELVSKKDVNVALRDATKNTQKGEYHKTRHAFDLLERIDPNLVRTASVHADGLFKVLQRETSS